MFPAQLQINVPQLRLNLMTQRESPGVNLSGRDMNINFLRKSARTWNSMPHYVVPNKTDPSYIVSVLLSHALDQHYSVPSSSIPLWQNFSKRASFFQPFWRALIRKPAVCGKLASPRASRQVGKMSIIACSCIHPRNYRAGFLARTRNSAEFLLGL